MVQCDEAVRRSLHMPVKVYVMIGIAGSGKTTTSKIIADSIGAEIFSSDAIREEIYGDESIQGNSKEVFDILYRRATYEAASNGCPVILDATNISRKNRKNIFKAFKNVNAEFIAVVMDTPFIKCLEQNNMRSRNVPEQIIRTQNIHFQFPSVEEGFDQIWVYKSSCGKFKKIL